MNKYDSMKLVVPAVLLASVVAVAEEWRPSGFEPAPVFEDEGLVGRTPPPRTPPAEPAVVSVPKDSPPSPAAEKHPSPAEPAAVAVPKDSPSPPAAGNEKHPSPPPSATRSSAAPEETVAPGANGHPPAFEPPPVFEDEELTGRRAPPRTPPVAAKAPEPAPVVAPVVQADAPAPAAERPVAGTVRSEPPPAAQSSGTWTDLLAANYPIGLIVLALAGYVFWNTRRAGRNTPQARNRPAGSGLAAPTARSTTGVAKYLESLGSETETRVAKYLKNLGE